MLCAIAEGLLPAPDAAIFADTGWENPADLEYMEEHIRPLASRAGVELIVCRRSETPLKKHLGGGLLDSSPASLGKPLPPMFFRQPDGSVGKSRQKCTGEWKRDVINHVLAKRFGKMTMRRHWVCFSTDECARAQKPSVANTPPLRKFRFPLLELKWTRRESIRFVERCGLPTPPQSACFICPLQTDGEWNKLKRERPLVFWRAAEIEAGINDACAEKLDADFVAFHRSGARLADVIFKDGDSRRLFCDSGDCFT